MADRSIRNELSGTVAGPSVQAGVVHGGVHFTGVAASPTPAENVPWQLPPAARMVGRQAELQALERLRERAAQDECPVLAVVTGLGGVGKTTLLATWLHRLRQEFHDGALYAHLGAHSPGGPVDPRETLGRFLRDLGTPPDRIPQAADERVSLYRSLTADRRLVLLLDDARTAAQVRPLLPSGPSVAAVTSRWRLPGLTVDGAHPLALEPLDTESAVEVLALTLIDGRIEAEREEARTLVELCAGLPLAVRLAGARLAARPQRSIRAMVRALVEEHNRLEGLAVRGDHNVRAALDLSYCALPSSAARLYRLLGLHPGPDFGFPVAVAAWGMSEGTAYEAAAQSIDLLHEANLLTDAGSTGNERYRFHDLVRLHAAAQAEQGEPLEQRSAALRRMFDHYLATATGAEATLDPHHRTLPRTYAPGPVPVVAEGVEGDEERALAWLDKEQHNLMAVLRRARQVGMASVTWQLVDAMWPLFVRRKYYDHSREAHREGLAAARDCGDAAAEARMLTSGGLVELGSGAHARALEMFEAAARLFQERGDELGYARTLNYRGLAQQRLGRAAEAGELFTRATIDCPRCGDPRTGGLARLNLAELALTAGRYEDAVREASAAQRTLRETDDSYNAVRAELLRGRAHLIGGAPETAEAILTGALTELRAMKADREVARGLESLAQVAEVRGERDSARERYREAQQLYAALQLPAAARSVEARLEQLAGHGHGGGDGRDDSGGRDSDGGHHECPGGERACGRAGE